MSWVLAAITLAAVIYTYAAMPSMRLTGQSWGKVPTAEEGLPIAVLFGTALTDPNIVYFGDTKQEMQTVFDPPAMEFSAAIQFCLCHGYVDQVVAVYSGGKELWKGRHSLEYEIATSPKGWQANVRDEATGDGFRGSWHLYRGQLEETTDDGTPEDLYQRYMATNATGNKIWKMNGIATLTPSGQCMVGTAPTLKPLAFRVQSIWRSDGGNQQVWYPSKAAIIIGRDYSDIWKYHLQAATDPTDCSPKAFNDSAWEEGPGGFGNSNVGTPGQGYYTKGKPWASRVPEVGTCIADNVNAWAWEAGAPATPARVIAGTKIWVRGELGPLPYRDLVVRCYHDDGAALWFNGTSITLYPMNDSKDAQAGKFNSIGYIDKDLIHATSNVVAFKVTDSVPTGSPEYLYAAISVGLDKADPCVTVDMNPAHIVYRVLTDTVWGLGYPASDIDDTAFQAAADILYDERLGISILWNQQSTFEDFLSEILRHIDGVLYVDRTSGKFVLKLLRDDYSVGSLITLDYDSIGTIDNAIRKSTSELVNNVIIKFRRAPLGDSGSVSLANAGLIQAQGVMISETLDFPGLTNEHSADLVAQRVLRALSTPLLSCTLNNCSRKAADLQIGDAFVLDWATLDIDSQVMRVTSIHLGDGANGAVTVECIEDVFFTPTKPLAVVGGIYFPPQVLGPLPGVTSGTKFYMCKKYDQKDRTSLEIDSVFIGAHEQGGNNPMFSDGAFTETAPGVMTRAILGEMPDFWFDDHAPTVGKAYIAWFQGDWEDNANVRYELAHEGIYRLDNVGSATEYAQFTRLDGYNTKADFIQGMTFLISNGTLYGGKYLQFLNPIVTELGTQLLFWALLDSYLPNDGEALLTSEEMSNEDLLLAPVESSRIVSASAPIDFDLAFVSRPLERSNIPAGPWSIKLDGVWLDVDAPGETNTIGFHIYKATADGSILLFDEEYSESIHSEEAEPILLQFNKDELGLIEGQWMLAIPYFKTTSISPITCNIRFNTPAKDAFVALPIEPTKTSIKRHIYSGSRSNTDAVLAGKVITVPESTGAFDVTLIPGQHVIGIAAPYPANGDMLVLTLLGATSANPVIVETGASVPEYALPIYTGLGNLSVTAARAQIMLVYNAAEESWQISDLGATAGASLEYMPVLDIATGGKLTLVSGTKFYVNPSGNNLALITVPPTASDETTLAIELLFTSAVIVEHMATSETGFANIYIQHSSGPGGGNLGLKNVYGAMRLLYKHNSYTWMVMSFNAK